jgi:Icc-related predicted phosphoesterase
MTLTRIQASDLQDATPEVNLSKLEKIAAFANSSGTNSVDLVGDLFDAHLIQALFQEKGATEETQKQAGQFMMQYYSAQSEILSKLKAPYYIIPGNNDTMPITEIIKGAKYPSLEKKIQDDKQFGPIIGISNTNYKDERFFPEELSAPQDGPTAYDTYSVKKTGGKKAKIIMLHGPPNGFREGKDTPEADGVTKLINEHKQPGQFMLVECGHFHKAELTAVKDKDGKGGYVVARSSPNIFYQHQFDDGGNYKSTKIYGFSN